MRCCGARREAREQVARTVDTRPGGGEGPRLQEATCRTEGGSFGQYRQCEGYCGEVVRVKSKQGTIRTYQVQGIPSKKKNERHAEVEVVNPRLPMKLNEVGHVAGGLVLIY